MARTEMKRGTLRAMTVGLNDDRTRVLLLMPRSHRPEYESKIDMIAHTETVHSTYLRPREGKEAIRESGMEPDDHSFHLIDIATKDLGVWMQDLIKQGWGRTNMEIVPSNDEVVDLLCFAHPSSTNVERLPLPWNPFDAEGRCYNHIPDGTIITNMTPEVIESDEIVEEDSSVSSEIVEVEPVEAVVETTKVVVAETPASELLEEEVRRTIDLLRADGMDMMQVMEHPKFAEVSERAGAANVDVWTMVVNTFQ
ncbi:MAG: hypothetical protein VX433_07155 [Candidatus Thermoplasmatota archaeon]|nr:hypothetical protein [Candidatus Thermoplasmatota archaeon]